MRGENEGMKSQGKTTAGFYKYLMNPYMSLDDRIYSVDFPLFFFFPFFSRFQPFSTKRRL